MSDDTSYSNDQDNSGLAGFTNEPAPRELSSLMQRAKRDLDVWNAWPEKIRAQLAKPDCVFGGCWPFSIWRFLMAGT